MYIKHYWVDESGEYIIEKNASPKTHPNIFGLDVKYWLTDLNSVDYCLSEVPDDTSIDLKDGIEILSKSEWDSIVASIPTPEDIEWKEIRDKRNQLLRESDWTQQRDVTLDNDSEWVSYREELRNIPQIYSKPIDVTWPSKP